jgi:serine/threonine-protein kinase
MPGPTTEPDTVIGTVLQDRWRVLSRLGSGAMGVVYLAEQSNLRREVALKLLHEEYVSSDEYVRRFEREARALSRLQHIHCASILDVGQHENRPYIVMELVHGHPLTVEIGTPKMTPKRAAGIVRQLLMGLRHAHGHGIVHRDLKPDNLMITELAGVGDVVKILDFGFAHITDMRHSQSNAQLVPGTPSYMSPEQAKGLRADARSDLYSTGIILYELAVGHKPFFAREPLEVLQMHINEPPIAPRVARPERNISAELEAVILQALAKNRDERFADAEAFQLALEATPEGRAAARAIGLANGGSAVQRARRWALGAAAVALIAIVVALVALGRQPKAAEAITGERPAPLPQIAPTATVTPVPQPRLVSPAPRPEPEPETKPPPKPRPRKSRSHRHQVSDPEQPKTRR